MSARSSRELHFLAIFSLLTACSPSKPEADPGSEAAKPAISPPAARRLVTLTPSATELVAALGATKLLVGVDRFTAEAAPYQGLEVVGDFLNPSFEAIARLAPDLVIADELQSKVARGLDRAEIATLSLPMHDLGDVSKGLRALGAALGRERRASDAIATIEGAVSAARQRASQRGRRARVLIVLDRQDQSLAGMVAAGANSWAAQLLEIIGADNVLAASTVRYPRISAEQILRGRPDVIIDASQMARDLGAWSELATVPAVANGRVVAASDRAVSAPSPRIAEAIAALERVVYGAPKP